MAFNNEIEEVKAQIKVLEKKLSFLEELSQTKSPVEEAYKDWWGEYPPTNPSVDNIFDIRWRAFQMGYNAAYEEKVSQEPEEKVEPFMFNCIMKGNPPDGYVTWGEWYNELGSKGILHNLRISAIEYQEPEVKKLQEKEWDAVRESVKWFEENPNKNPLDWVKPQTPEQVSDGLKEAFREAVKQGIIPEVKQPTDELVDKLTKNPPEFLKFELGKTLEDICMRWWDDIFSINSSWDSVTSVQDLCDRIFLWLPKEQDSSGTQRLETEIAVDTHNELLRKIKSKIHNKKV